MRIVKLDRRYDGHDRFTHRIEFIGRGPIRVHQWVRVRNWLWAQFGPSGELFCARPDYFDGIQPKWAWNSDKSAIYLIDEAYTLFILKKDSWNEQNL